ncbi:MAG: ornithine cyclodeaminase family protein [Flavobacteriaceae bacterium]|nr:ornithine cyclodeaminase family protein [Flavobacteriaceae bacterium]
MTIKNCFPKISKSFIDHNTDFKILIDLLEKAFAENKVIVPKRHHHNFDNPNYSHPTTMLIMPAWTSGKDGGVKIVTVNPNNTKLNLPSIQGSYVYLDALTGLKKADIEVTSLTSNRTAATSALASKFLSHKRATSLLMIGTGSLAIPLIKAHKTVRDIKKVYLWGRNHHKTETIAKNLKYQNFTVEIAKKLNEVIPKADIISSATLSSDPLIEGSYLRSGQHIDLVGSFKPTHRESDDECILKSTLFLDSLENLYEGGDIAIPLERELIGHSDIRADLFGLCQGKHSGRTSDSEITLFNSVGHALEDLIAARYYYNLYLKFERKNKTDT